MTAKHTERREQAYVDRGDAVNLARDLIADSHAHVTAKGIEILCEAVLNMDAALLAEDKAGREVVAWGFPARDTGEIIDCITPAEHDREPGRYNVPLYTRPAPIQQEELLELQARNQELAALVGQQEDRKPLTDEEISELYEQVEPLCTPYQFKLITRAIESAHGITAQNHKD